MLADELPNGCEMTIGVDKGCGPIPVKNNKLLLYRMMLEREDLAVVTIAFETCAGPKTTAPLALPLPLVCALEVLPNVTATMSQFTAGWPW